jgi:hypothetical protein
MLWSTLRSFTLLSAALVIACGDDDGTPRTDAGPGRTDSGVRTDAGGRDSGSGSDAGGSDAGGSDAGGSDAGETAVYLSNVARDCEENNSIGAVLPDEAGHYAATTLTPATYPATVSHIGYHLVGTNDDCLGGLAHDVLVYVLDDVRPPNEPTDEQLVATIEVAASTSVEDIQMFEHALEAPITLTTGQHLVVAIQMNGNEELTHGICVMTCDTGGEANEDWWSNAAAVPFAWADMFSARAVPSSRRGFRRCRPARP